VPKKPSKLLPGLEESKGALYEIGVADDGSLVGLTRDEMNESLTNLRAMAASLGCSVDVLRMVQVGECDWMEHESTRIFNSPRAKTIKLYVVEAYVKPEFTSSGNVCDAKDKRAASAAIAALEVDGASDTVPAKQQLRVSLTGATTSGKSSLLGTLSTSTLDNSRGKSRLSLLKHRHEIASGMTSSVAQELIGYRDEESEGDTLTACHVVNYATGNVSSWNDIHASSESGRLALLSDSAGHPKFRRTTVRGLVGWAPHWVILCIAANSDLQEAHKSPTPDGSPFAGAAAHLSMAHLDICLRLNIPLIISVTKFDAATKTSFRQLLSTILTVLKTAGRKPLMLATNSQDISEDELQTIAPRDFLEIEKAVEVLKKDTILNVPILFTSAVKGIGIGKLHALLRQLPVTTSTSRKLLDLGQTDEYESTTLFHIDDVYKLRIRDMHNPSSDPLPSHVQGTIISGHLSRGTISVGDVLSLGPFTRALSFDTIDTTNPLNVDDPSTFLFPRSFTDALYKATASPKLRTLTAPPESEHEWIRVTVISIRNLKLPVKRLDQDQVGTIGVLPLKPPTPSPNLELEIARAIRKGMILGNGTLDASHTFTAAFDVEDAGSAVVGSLVLIYCATLRASAKVIAVALNTRNNGGESREGCNAVDELLRGNDEDENSEEDGFRFELDEDDRGDDNTTSKREDVSRTILERGHDSINVTFQFVRCREYIEVGARILVMPGGGPSLHDVKEKGLKGIGGLEGIVGTVLERFG